MLFPSEMKDFAFLASFPRVVKTHDIGRDLSFKSLTGFLDGYWDEYARLKCIDQELVKIRRDYYGKNCFRRFGRMRENSMGLWCENEFRSGIWTHRKMFILKPPHSIWAVSRQVSIFGSESAKPSIDAHIDCMIHCPNEFFRWNEVRMAYTSGFPQISPQGRLHSRSASCNSNRRLYIQPERKKTGSNHIKSSGKKYPQSPSGRSNEWFDGYHSGCSFWSLLPQKGYSRLQDTWK